MAVGPTYLTSIGIAQTNTHNSNSLTSHSGSIAPQAYVMACTSSYRKNQNKDYTINKKMPTKPRQQPVEKVHYFGTALQHPSYSPRKTDIKVQAKTSNLNNTGVL